MDVEQGKDPLVSPSEEWARQYRRSIDGGQAQPPSRRRRRYRLRPRDRHRYRRALKTAVLCSLVFLAMAAGLYVTLEKAESRSSILAPGSAP